MYQELIDAEFIRRDALDPRPPDGFLHPSSMGGCDRNAVYGVATEPSNPPDARGLRVMGRGTEMHETIQGLAKAKWPGLLTEVQFEYGRVKGSADALLPVADGLDHGLSTLQPVYELQEYKSMNPNGFRYLKDAKPEHVKQARIYHWGLQRVGYLLEGIIRIVYFDRDSWACREFEVPAWDMDEVEQFELNLDIMLNHVEEGTLPAPMDLKYWLCKYCNYRTLCRGEDADR